jgi:AcrR family transcriptional regulator
MSPKIVDKKKKKKQILLAAMKVFSEKGVKNSRIADIANKADIGKGTIYEYFRNRDEILSEAFDLIMNDMGERIDLVLKETNNPEEKISAVISVTYGALQELSPDLIQIFLDFWSEGIRQTDKSKPAINLRSLYSDYRRQLSDILNDGIKQGLFRPMDTTCAASTIMAIIDGLLLQIILDNNVFDNNKIIDEMTGMILTGVRKYDN